MLLKCPNCGAEIVLAETCPYCGYKIKQEVVETEEKHKRDRHTGRFRGRVDQSKVATPGLLRWVLLLIRYMTDSQVSLGKKMLILMGFMYILSPLDLIAIVPIVAWLDDLAVVAMLYSILRKELTRYPGDANDDGKG